MRRYSYGKGSTLDGGADNDSLIGGSGADLFNTVSDYGTGNDTIQLTTNATVTVSGNNVTSSTGEGDSASVMVVEGAKNSFITTKDSTNTKTARYYADGAEVVKDGNNYTLVLGSNFKTTTAKASDYTQTGEISVRKVSLSDVGAESITFYGFDSINGFRADKDSVSVSVAPTDAKTTPTIKNLRLLSARIRLSSIWRRHWRRIATSQSLRVRRLIKLRTANLSRVAKPR